MIPDTLPEALSRALAQRGYTDLTPVQLAVAKPETADRDLLVSARTGSGKTVAYGLALAQDLLGRTDALPPAGAPLALVVAPTRELALQVQRELEWLYAAAGARVVSCVGGMDPRREQRLLTAGAHIVVGTPGRLRDHLERGNLKMGELSAVVLDEADEMLDLGFREELEALLDAAPAERRTLLFSATLPKPILAIARQYQKEALRLTVGGGAEEGHADIDYRAITLAPSDMEHAVVNLLRYFEAGGALVFCNTREAVRRLHANLVERGFSVVALSGEMTQNERTHALQALRDRRTRVCVATDVAARGIDIPDLELVIHAELPTGAESLQHRSGRTGRAGKKGISAILVPYPKRRRAEALMRTARIEATWGPAPSAEDIRAKDQERLIEQLRPEGEPAEDDVAVAKALLAGADPEAVVACLVRARRAAMPSPEDLVETAPQSAYAPEGSQGAHRGARETYARPEPRPGFEDTQWFSINIGQRKNAEARWLLPLICRRGHLTKTDIGAIRVFDRETRFEIVKAALERFEAAIAKAEDDGVVIERAEPDLPAARDRKPYQKERFATHDDVPRPPRAAPPADFTPRPQPPVASPRPYAGKPPGPKPFAGKPPGGKPHTSQRQDAKFTGPARKPFGKPKRG